MITGKPIWFTRTFNSFQLAYKVVKIRTSGPKPGKHTELYTSCVMLSHFSCWTIKNYRKNSEKASKGSYPVHFRAPGSSVPREDGIMRYAAFSPKIPSRTRRRHNDFTFLFSLAVAHLAVNNSIKTCVCYCIKATLACRQCFHRLLS